MLKKQDHMVRHVLILAILLAGLWSACTDAKKPDATQVFADTVPASGQIKSLMQSVARIDSLGDAGDLLSMESLLRQLLVMEEECAGLPLGPQERAWAYDQIGEALLRLGDLLKAREYSEKACQWLGPEMDLTFRAGVLINAANIASDLGDYDRATEYLFEGMEAYGSDTTHRDFIDFYNNLGGVYGAREDYDLAILYFDKMKALAETLGLEQEYGFYHGNVGHLYMMAGEVEKSIRHFEQAKQYFSIHHQIEEELLLNPILASVYIRSGRLEEAGRLLEGNLQEVEQRQLWMSYVETTISLFDYYIALGDSRRAFQAIDKGLGKIHISNTARLKLKIYDRLIEYHETEKQFDQAFTLLRERHLMSDSLVDVSKDHLMRELTVRYETNRKNDQIGHLTTLNQQKQRLMVILSVGFGLLLIVIVFIVFLIRRISRQNKQLEEANAAKDKLFSLIAHDLRSPLGALQGVSPLIQDYVEADDKAGLLKLADYTDLTLNQINQLLDNLLRWAVANTHQITMNRVEIDLAVLIKDATTLYKSGVENKEIRLLELVEPAAVPGDQAMLSSVIRNVLSNAVNHTPRAGVIQLHGMLTSDGVYKLVIQNSGKGFPENILKDFLQAPKTLLHSGRSDSFGLGLRLGSFFVQKHGGQLLLSNTATGAKVEILIPLVR